MDIKDDNGTGVVFEDEVRERFSIAKLFPKRTISVMAEWLVKHKMAKNLEQANLLLLAFSLFAFSLAMVILYIGSFYVNPEDNQTVLIAPQSPNSTIQP